MSKNEETRCEFFKCSCYSHALEVEHDMELDICNLSIWHYGHEGDAPLCFKERLRWAWKLITTGNLWADSIVLSAESRDKLIEFLKYNEKTPKNEKNIIHG